MDDRLTCPFTILVDSAEQLPYSFTHLRADAKHKYCFMDVPTDRQSLGRHPDSLGDYSVVGCVGQCHVERKSRQDAHSTFLGFGRTRDRFEQELRNLSEIKAAMVAVECTMGQLLRTAPMHGVRTEQQNAKSLFRTIHAFIQDYGVPFMFYDDRRMAEQGTFRFLSRFWHKQQEAIRKGEIT